MHTFKEVTTTRLSGLTDRVDTQSQPLIEPPTNRAEPTVPTHLAELELRILRGWEQRRGQGAAEVLPGDFEQLSFERRGLLYTLKCCHKTDADAHEGGREGGCPLCDSVQRQLHNLTAVQLPSGRSWEIWVNKRSYAAYHILIMPLTGQGQPEHRCCGQEATRDDIQDMLALKTLLPHFCLFFNAHGAGNSQEHQHFQGFYADTGAVLQVEKQATQGLWQHGRFWMTQVEDWPAECIRMRGRHDVLAAYAAQAIQLARQKNLSYNLLFTGNALYFARRKQLGSTHLDKTAAGALDVFDLKHIVSPSAFEWAKTHPLQLPDELDSLYADITCSRVETQAFMREWIQLVGDAPISHLATNAAVQSQEATVLDILVDCAAGEPALRVAGRAKLAAFLKDELSNRKELAEAPSACGTPGHKWSRFSRWAESRLRPAEERIKDSEEVNKGLGVVDALVEASRCLLCREPFCTKGCPVMMDIKGVVKAFVNGDIQQAYAIIRKDNILPAITSRVCPQETQCQATCALAKRGDALSIGQLERAVVDLHDLFCACRVIDAAEIEDHVDIVMPEKDYPIAVIGAGPAGLTVASELARWYTRVVIFEALPEPGGGVLKYGIPGFRLPKDIVQAEIDWVKSRGVKLIFDVAVGRTLTIADLRQMGFRAIVLGTGAGLPKFMGIPGEELNGVVTANEFLMRYNLMSAGQPEYDTPLKVGRKVVIIGGGNVAMDSARSAMRTGAQEVIVMYRRAEVDMPVRAEELDRAREEGIIVMPLTALLEFLGVDGALTGARCQKMALGKPDESGRRSPQPIQGSEFIVDGVSSVILAIGTEPNTMLMDQERLPKGKWNTVALQDAQTGQTRQPDIFAAGDIAGGSTVIDAMGTARKAVVGVHTYLQSLPEDARRIRTDRRVLQADGYAITHREELASNIVLLKVSAPFVAAAARAGQFVMVMSDARSERIPLTIADWDADSGEITIVIQAVGLSTIKLCRRQVGERLFSVAGALGQPTHVVHDPQKDIVVCVAGGVGIAPLYPIARANVQAGNRVVSIIGVKSPDMLFWEDRMRAMSTAFTLTLDSQGQLVTDGLGAYLEEQQSNGGTHRIARVVAIGSAGMMQAVSKLTARYGIPTVVSLNSIMLCGIGMCGCDRENVNGQRVFTCVHGPEFESQSVDWHGVFARQKRYLQEEALARAASKG